MRRRDFIAGLSGVAAMPCIARGQQTSVPTIGLFNSGNENSEYVRDAFRRGLGELGYVERRNVEFFYPRSQGQSDRAIAEDFVGRQVSVIVSIGGAANFVREAKSATDNIPIVFGTANDPVAFGLVRSLNRPGGNTTGVFFLTGALVPKRLELLHEIVPGITSIGFLLNTTAGGTAENQIKEAENAARILGVRLTVLNAGTVSEIDSAFSSLAQREIGAVLTGSNGFYVNQRSRFTSLAARYAVPVIFPYREFVDAGGLMSYGPSIADAARIIGTYVGRILKGEKPSDLPIQQSTRIEMVLNLKTAKALGIDVPTATLLRATEVIE